MKSQPLWSPSQENAAKSRMAQFMAEVIPASKGGLGSYAELHAFSVRETESFWSKAWEFLGVIGERGTGPIHELGHA